MAKATATLVLLLAFANAHSEEYATLEQLKETNKVILEGTTQTLLQLNKTFTDQLVEMAEQMNAGYERQNQQIALIAETDEQATEIVQNLLADIALRLEQLEQRIDKLEQSTNRK